MTLLIMAAGLGSRYGGLKQLDGIGPHGELLIEFSIYDAIQAGFDRVVFIIKEEHVEAFEERITCKIRNQIKAEYAFQSSDNVPEAYPQARTRTKPLGTGHAILCAKDVIGEDDFAVINADDFYSREAFVCLAEFLKNKKEHCLVGYQLANTVSDNGVVSRGVCKADAQGNLCSVLEHEKIDASFTNHATPQVTLAADTIVSMNAWGFRPSVFRVFEEGFVAFLEQHKENLDTCEYYLTLPIASLLETETVKVLASSAKWYGVTYQADKEPVRAAIAALGDVYPERLWRK